MLNAKTVCHEEVLREEVESIITKQGLSKVGFALRFKESLGLLQFETTAEGVRLAATPV